ncbi:MAG: hypothetical protein H7330_03860 [Hymenobacteraceae bacterium]|nr:hypothetical protein [Hymenobacteraceae bacterium]
MTLSTSLTFARGLLLAALLGGPALSALGQSAAAPAPYPFTYGLGLPGLNQNFGSIRSLGLAGTGMALADEAYINDYNIALLPYNSLALMIDADVSYWSLRRTYFDQQLPGTPSVRRAASLSKFRIPAARVAYPLLSGTLVLRAAYQPVRPYEFRTQTVQLLPDTAGLLVDTLRQIRSGTARLRQYSLGAGFTMLRDLTGGLQVDYLTGTFSAASMAGYSTTRPDTAVALPDTAVTTTTTWTDAGKVTSWRLTGAVSHRLRLSQTLTLRSGLSATYSLPLRTKASPVAESAGASPLKRATTRIPILLRGGLSVSNDRTWRVGLDGAFQRWASYRSWSGQARYANAISLSAAGEYIPGGVNADVYWKRITYRAGLRYDNHPVEELSQSVSEISLGFGASLPVTSVLETRRSYANIGLRIGRASYPQADVYRATTFEVGVGFTYNSRLYIPVGRGNCPIPSCHVRKRHSHDGVDYGGQPWYKMQNPHIGEKLPYRKNTEKPKTNEKARFKF